MIAMRKGNSTYTNWSTKKIRFEIRTSDNSNSIEDLPTNSFESISSRVIFSGQLDLKTRDEMSTLLTTTLSDQTNTSILDNGTDPDILYAINLDSATITDFEAEKITLFSNTTSFYWIVLYNDTDVSSDPSPLEVYYMQSSEPLVDESDLSSYVLKVSPGFSYQDDETNVGWNIVSDISGNTIDMSGNQIVVPTDTSINFALNTYIKFRQFKSVIEAPGIASLIAERYVILRSKEIDDHVQMSYAFSSTNPGIALFKLGVLGFAQERFDFASIDYREIQPIGKLDKLSLRFERLDGELYDFKGVNHHMLIVIKFFSPKSEGLFTKSLLNPNYDPNFIEFIKEKRDFEEVNDSEEEEIEPSKRNEHMRIEKEYMQMLMNQEDLGNKNSGKNPSMININNLKNSNNTDGESDDDSDGEESESSSESSQGSSIESSYN